MYDLVIDTGLRVSHVGDHSGNVPSFPTAQSAATSRFKCDLAVFSPPLDLALPILFPALHDREISSQHSVATLTALNTSPLLEATLPYAPTARAAPCAAAFEEG